VAIVSQHPAGKTNSGAGTWSVVSLGELVSRIEYGSSAKSKTIGQVPVLRMGNLNDGKLKWNDLVYTDDEAEIRKYLLRAGDVLFNRTNTIDLVGKTALYIGERPAIFAGYLIRVTVSESLLDPRFLNYVLNTEASRKYSRRVLSVADFANYICGPRVHNHFLVYLFRYMSSEWKKLMAGSIHNTVYMPVFRTLRIALPSRAEQEEIASILADMDDDLAALEYKLAKARQLKQGMMEELLTGRIRLINHKAA